jgi:hypothetical protein
MTLHTGRPKEHIDFRRTRKIPFPRTTDLLVLLAMHLRTCFPQLSPSDPMRARTKVA